jgi:hypothetical protein
MASLRRLPRNVGTQTRRDSYMTRIILLFGLAAGLIVTVPMDLMLAHAKHDSAATSMFTGYLMMVLALSMVSFSVVAGVIYVIGWEITLAVTDFEFIDSYSTAAIEAARAKGASAADIAAVVAQMDEFRRQYANPFFRLPMTFIEIFPVGILISLISAALLRNSRFLPARAPAR